MDLCFWVNVLVDMIEGWTFEPISCNFFRPNLSWWRGIEKFTMDYWDNDSLDMNEDSTDVPINVDRSSFNWWRLIEKFSVEESEVTNGDLKYFSTGSRSLVAGQDFSRELVWAACQGDMKAVRGLIKCGALNEYLDKYEIDERKKVMEQIFAKLITVDILLENGIAIVPSQEYVHGNPTDRALFKVTLIRGTDVVTDLFINVSAVRTWNATRDQVGRKPLHIICGLPDVHPDTVMYILENSDDDINVRTYYNYTALIIAASCGNFALVKFLVENGACVNDFTVIPIDAEDQCSHYAYMKIFSPREVVIPPVPYFFSALVAAVFEGHKDILIYLLNNGADININNDTWTTLFHPVIMGRKRVVEILLENGIDANIKDIMGSTALHKAAEEGHLEIASLLLKSGANVKAVDNYGWTPLHIACLFSCTAKIAMIKLLLDSGSDVNAETSAKFTPLTLAEAGNNYQFLEYLISKIDTLDTTMQHPSMMAEDYTEEHVEVIKLLMKHGANYNHQDDLLGWSALHWAGAEDDLAVAELLMSYGAVVSSRSKMSLTPYETAKYFDRPAVSRFLSTAKDVV